jgi:hypothetical protein
MGRAGVDKDKRWGRRGESIGPRPKENKKKNEREKGLKEAGKSKM